MPPTRPPNLLGKERSHLLTKSAQRLQERDCRRCARNTPKKKYSLPAQSSLPLLQTGLCRQPYLHMSPKSGEESPSDRRALSSAIMCRPIKAYALTVSADTQGPNSINSLRTTGSSLQKEEEELAIRPRTSLGLLTAWRLYVDAHCPTDPSGAKRPPRSASSTRVGESLCPHHCEASFHQLEPAPFFHTSVRVPCSQESASFLFPSA